MQIDDLTATQWARGTIRSEMAKRGLTYAELTALLVAFGLDENERALRNKIARGTFSAAFFLQVLSAMAVQKIDIASLPMTHHIRKREITSEFAADPELLDKIEALMDADAKARRGE